MWTKEETDKLFDLCEQFDLRFIVVADRFPTSRTVEELKNRYYSGILHKYPVTFSSFFLGIQSSSMLMRNERLHLLCLFLQTVVTFLSSSSVSRAILIARAPAPSDVAGHPLVKVCWQ